MEERIELASAQLKNDQKKLINKNAEIYGACRHKAKFYVYEQVKPTISTDEEVTQKKKLDESINVISDNKDDTQLKPS